ncbi:MAG TPA: M28 family metallopeptidase [Terriglobales bacterium]|jgi:N-acetylated-alpha-linked acidic dipeptidase
MKVLLAATLALAFLFPNSSSIPTQASNSGASSASASDATPIFGFRDPSTEHALESRFLAVPDPKTAEADLRILTQAPHMAGTPEDKATADYVAKKFRAAGLETSISEYRVWMNYPAEMKVTVTAPAGVKMQGPTAEHVEGDAYENDPRIVMPFNSMSPSGDVEAEVVYANYGRPEDFKKLEEMKIDVRGKIVLCRYGQNFRGVKVLDAQEHGAAGVIIYSDPYDDGWRRGDAYPKGPWRPQTGVQRGSVGFMFKFPGDPTTPGIASLPSLPQSKRTSPNQSQALPKIPSLPISYGDAWPILANLGGTESPRDWQGALPFTYHVGPGPVRVKMHIKQDYQYRTIWDVIGRIPGSEFPNQTVIAGNHRDAWVFGAADPGSGTAAMLETVRGVGELLKSGWKPKRTVIFASWDGEEEGLIGSTEWAEDHATELEHAVAYFNTDVAVSGPKFEASAVPSLKDFVRDITKSVSSPAGGTVFDQWTKARAMLDEIAANTPEAGGSQAHPPAVQDQKKPQVGDLGSGSDYTVFLQHLGVPSTDIGSTGSYGVYHSAFDDFQWFKQFGDPNFLYEQQMARLFGLETLRMANTDVLPYDYKAYGEEVNSYLAQAQKKADSEFGGRTPNFTSVEDSARRFKQAGEQMWSRQQNQSTDVAATNQTLTKTERALLLPEGLPDRPWYRHAIYAPGMHTGYAAVVIPGVNEAIERHDLAELNRELEALAGALNGATQVLESH